MQMKELIRRDISSNPNLIFFFFLFFFPRDIILLAFYSDICGLSVDFGDKDALIRFLHPMGFPKNAIIPAVGFLEEMRKGVSPIA